MKYRFLGSRSFITVISLIVGLYAGFKVANSQYRMALDRDLQATIAGAGGAAGAGRGASAQTREVIEKARNNPDDIEAQLDAADQFMQVSQPAEALPFLQQALRVDDKDPRTLAGLGMVSFLSGNYQEAIDWASRSLELRPRNPGASFLLISSYIRTNQKLDEAERMIAELESNGIDQSMIGSIRAELNAARGTSAGTKTMLDHGPAEKRPEK
ncbi:MAG: tetratricopeptide repeat protein [Blastocatellia bacterium]